MKSTETLYNERANDWARDERILLSDFTARPRVIEELKPLDDLRVLDLGCGEGYVARLVEKAGARLVIGVDKSAEMIARAQQAANGSKTFFGVADAAEFSPLTDFTFDRAMAVFLFNYLTRAEMERVMLMVRKHVVSGGRFVFTVPHPCFPYMRTPSRPFYFNTGKHDYFAGVDRTFEGEIWRRDSVSVPVRCVHKTWTDYFEALNRVGFTKTPKVIELHVTDEHVRFDPGFFGPLQGYPLHVLFSVEVP